MSQSPKALIKSPILHFILLGSLFYLLQTTFISQSAPSPDHEIHVRSADIAPRLLQWTRSTGRPPSENERKQIIQQFVDNEILVREAIARGWNRTDALIQRRLVQNMRFLDTEDQASDDKLLRKAWELGMDRSDLVVRRRLIARMEYEITDTERRREIGKDELTGYYTRHRKRFTAPATIRLTQIFLSRDRRGKHLERDAKALYDQLVQKSPSPETAIAQGDPFLFPAQLPPMSRSKLAGQFGAAFADAVFQAKVHRWVGPIASSYGLHIVWIQERVPEKPIPLASIRDRVEAELRRQREKKAFRTEKIRLRKNYRIIRDFDQNTAQN